MGNLVLLFAPTLPAHKKCYLNMGKFEEDHIVSKKPVPSLKSSWTGSQSSTGRTPILRVLLFFVTSCCPRITWEIPNIPYSMSNQIETYDSTFVLQQHFSHFLYNVQQWGREGLTPELQHKTDKGHFSQCKLKLAKDGCWGLTQSHSQFVTWV